MFEGVNRISRIYWVRICNEECRRKHIEFTIFFLNSIIFSIDYKLARFKLYHVRNHYLLLVLPLLPLPQNIKASPNHENAWKITAEIESI